VTSCRAVQSGARGSHPAARHLSVQLSRFDAQSKWGVLGGGGRGRRLIPAPPDDPAADDGGRPTSPSTCLVIIQPPLQSPVYFYTQHTHTRVRRAGHPRSPTSRKKRPRRPTAKFITFF